jgi:hypothetical protein
MEARWASFGCWNSENALFRIFSPFLNQSDKESHIQALRNGIAQFIRSISSPGVADGEFSVNF